MRFTAKIENGKTIWHDIGALKSFLSGIEGEVYIDIKPSNTRNTAQNNYYWALLRDWGKAIGYSAEELHEVVKSKFKIVTTSEFNKNEFSEFLDEVIRYACENGYSGKDPRLTKPL